jgi:hypothetical protein
MRQYPKHNGTEDERGFTADEIRRGIHTLYADNECPECGRIQPVAAGHLCQRCQHDFN